MEQKIKKAFLIICLLFVSLPLIFVVLRIRVEDRYSSKPINGNFERNFPLKDDYFSIYSYIKENLFQVNPIPEKVLLGPGKWLFCGDSFSDNFSESMALINFNTKEIDTIKQSLIDKKNWSKSNGIIYNIAIAPNKETVYGDLIPIIKNKKLTKTEQLDSLCHKINLNYIDLGSNFPKKRPDNLYHKTDTHWTEYGGYLGYTSIIDALNKNNFNLSPISIKNLKIEKSNVFIGDLNEMLRRKIDENLVAMKYINYKENATLVKDKLKVPDGYPNDPETYELRFKAKGKKLKILVLCDSFGGYFAKFLKENFNETVFIWDTKFDKELILQEKPDIIIQELVARNVDFLLKKEN